MMSMKRTDSSSTTFSEIMQKNSMYQASLFVLNIVLIISSVVMIFSGYTLITTYHFDKIYYPNSKLEDLWPFHGLPWTMIGTGVSTLIIAILGFIVFALQIRPLIMLYAALLIPLILAKFGMIYITFKVESALRSDSSQLDNVGYHTEVRTLYHEKDDFRESWDILQTHLRCCGGENYEDFYHWNGLKKDYTCYPKSCCVDKDNTYGECVLKDGRNCPDKPGKSSGDSSGLWTKINLRGCFPILQEMYDIRLYKGNAFLAIEVGGAFTLIVEIASLATSVSFIGQITRGLKKDLYFGVSTN